MTTDKLRSLTTLRERRDALTADLETSRADLARLIDERARAALAGEPAGDLDDRIAATQRRIEAAAAVIEAARVQMVDAERLADARAKKQTARDRLRDALAMAKEDVETLARLADVAAGITIGPGHDVHVAEILAVRERGELARAIGLADVNVTGLTDALAKAEDALAAAPAVVA